MDLCHVQGNNCNNLILQEQSARREMPDHSPEDTEDMSPLPRGKPSRRGGISAEPVTEEDATSYVKKVTVNKTGCNIEFGFV